MTETRSLHPPFSEHAVISVCKELFGEQIETDNPFSSATATVLRHRQSRKWFGLLMEVPLCKLGAIIGCGESKKTSAKTQNAPSVAILNLKADPLLKRDGVTVLPAYHMNKKHWISVILENISRDELEYLICQSFELTRTKPKKH